MAANCTRDSMDAHLLCLGHTMLTIGQYLQPSGGQLPVLRYVHPDTFKMFETEALKMGFKNAACGPMVRSSYWADQQAHGAGVV